MKKIITLILAVVMVFAVTACNRKNDSSSSDISSSSISSSSQQSMPEPSSSAPSSSEIPSSSEDSSSLSGSSDSSNPESNIEDVDIAAIAPDYDFETLPADKIQWGPGVHKNADGRPTAPVSLQEQYGKYATYFLAPFSEKVYLTFDNGYEHKNAEGVPVTEIILDVLKEKQVSAVFFVTQPYVKNNPDIIRRMIDEGHIIGSHSVNHKSMPTLTDEECVEEILGLHNYVLDNFGYEMKLFRPPMGEFSEKSLAITHSLGYQSVCWSFAYQDYLLDDQPTYEYALEKITSNIHAGAIYLLHAVSETNAAVLGEAIDKIREEGFEFSRFNLVYRNEVTTNDSIG